MSDLTALSGDRQTLHCNQRTARGETNLNVFAEVEEISADLEGAILEEQARVAHVGEQRHGANDIEEKDEGHQGVQRHEEVVPGHQQLPRVLVVLVQRAREVGAEQALRDNVKHSHLRHAVLVRRRAAVGNHVP
jgi:hypothetical protein